MKVGTDGVLLGAWAEGGQRILDIGSGTGLISLMMAQRFPEAQVWGIDIDPDACMQARENVAASPFADRDMDVVHDHARHEFDGIARLFLGRCEEARDVAAIRERDGACDVEPLILLADEAVMHIDMADLADGFLARDRRPDDVLDDGVVDAELAVVAEDRPHDGFLAEAAALRARALEERLQRVDEVARIVARCNDPA